MSKSPQISFTNFSIKQYYWILALVVVLVFGNTLFNGYNYDDNLVTMHHPLTSKGFKAIGKIFTSPYYSNGADIKFGYRPIVHVSFAIEHQLFGEKPGVSHFFNLLIYLGCVLVFFKLISNWFGQQGLFFAFAAAVVFAVHPIHSEAVASIKNRDELLAFLFAMLAFVQLNKYADKQQWWRIGLVVLFFVIGLLAKKSIYPLVFLVPLVLLFIHQQKTLVVLINTFVFSLTVGAIASDLMLNRLMLLTGFPLLFCLLLIGWVNRKAILKRLSRPAFKTALPYVLMIFVALFTIATIYYQDYIFFVVVILALAYLFYTKANVPLVSLVTVTSFLVVGNELKLHVLFSVALLISLLVLAHQFANKRNLILSVIAAVLPIVVLIIGNPNFGVVLLILNLATASYFIEKKSWLGIITLVLLAVAALYFNVKYFNIMLLLLSFVLITNKWLTLKGGYQLNALACVILMLLPILFLPKTPVTQLTNYWSGIKSAEHQVQGSTHFDQSALNTNKSAEGRGLSYVENTLVGTTTREAKIATGLLTIGEYVRLMVWPDELNFYYGFAKIKTGSFSDKMVWFWLIIFLCMSWFFIWFMRKNKLLSLGIIWFVGCLLLFSNWVELVAGMVGERLAFTASAGFCLILLALILQWNKAKSVSKPTIYLLLVIIIAFSFRTVARNSNWESHLVLMEHDMEQLSESVYANHMYALTCMNEATTNQRLTKPQVTKLVTNAEQALKRATLGYPNYFNAQFDLARLYIMQERFAEAKVYLTNAYQIDSTNLFVLEELAKTCFDLNQPEETIKYAMKYILSYTNNENVYEILAYTLYKQGAYNQAKKITEEGLTHFPQSKNLNGLLVDINKQIVLMPNISNDLLPR